MALGTIVAESNNWEILTNPIIIAILLTVGLAGIFVELLAPGHIIPGAIGVGAFILYFYGQITSGIAEMSAPIIFLIGLVLLIVEVVVPGGIFGTLGAIALFYSVVAAAKSVAVGVSALAIGIIAAILFIWILYKFFGFRTTWNKLILTDKQNNEEGYTSSKNKKHLIGRKGVALSALRPAGWAQIDGQKEDVVSEGELIPKDANIIVTNVEGTRVVVKKVDEEIE
ncbi:NfeD family protein [Shimazuella kribbensis]|uniref:NfeD family protein n=1 Tax=Shimazuella kribbensis TaxID=139808 RepID=UPI000413060E|nr:NfeD family protein [Shimazuella kribbensis]